MAVTVAVKPRPRAAIKLPRNVACMVPSLNRSEIVGGAGGTRTRTWDTPKRILSLLCFVYSCRPMLPTALFSWVLLMSLLPGIG